MWRGTFSSIVRNSFPSTALQNKVPIHMYKYERFVYTYIFQHYSFVTFKRFMRIITIFQIRIISRYIITKLRNIVAVNVLKKVVRLQSLMQWSQHTIPNKSLILLFTENDTFKRIFETPKNSIQIWTWGYNAEEKYITWTK